MTPAPGFDTPFPRNGGWSFETLLKHMMGIIESNDRRYEQRFADSATAVTAALTAARSAGEAALNAAKEAVVKAELASDKRFEGVNEFRETLADQQRTLMPRPEAELRLSDLERQIKEVKIELSRQIHELRTPVLAHINQQLGEKNMWGFLVGAIGVLVAAIALVMRFF